MKNRYKDEKEATDLLLKDLSWNNTLRSEIEQKSARLVEIIRKSPKKSGDLDTFLQTFSLDNPEGIALMSLAEALLRIPDKQTANELIADKISSADWDKKNDDSFFGKYAGLGLKLTKKTIDGSLSGIGKPIIRKSMQQAIEYMGSKFILGQNIEKAIKNSGKYKEQNYKFSYDMLGEGARTLEDAERHFESYWEAIEYIGNNKNNNGSCISIKLSALHPRYEFAQAENCVPEIHRKMMELCKLAASFNMSLTIDAEESERLDISLDILTKLSSDAALAGWDGLGLAVQAYQKRAYSLIDSLVELSLSHKRRLQVRLVKGAYWDSEIKNSQSHCHPDYPIFTRKFHTDLSYLACAQKLLYAKNDIYSMFATHNVHTVTSIMEMDKQISGGNSGGYEFQRLFGMGERLYNIVLKENMAPVSIYAPVGTHEELLAYLVRRMLENGANSSFVNKINNLKLPAEELVKCPVEKTRENLGDKNPQIPLPKYIFNNRKNSASIDLTNDDEASEILELLKEKKNYEACSIISGDEQNQGITRDIINPANFSQKIGTSYDATDGNIETAIRTAKNAFKSWNNTKASKRADILRNFANLLEKNRNHLVWLCVKEAGKTIPDANDEIREAIDFARYYAQQGETIFDENGTILQGITGEENTLYHHGKGVFLCISPWNFPLAIFCGQVLAALMAGNTVIAKPAEQTPIIASETVKLLLEAGLPEDAISLIIGAGNTGEKLVNHKDISGVVFTGSTNTAKAININLAKKEGAITPLIAETGGINAMIVDSSALPEQVVDDVISSAFGSAGQRCSALRVLCIHVDIAPKIIKMLKGALKSLNIGDPSKLSTDIGPLIDENSMSILRSHKSRISGIGKIIAGADIDRIANNNGHYFNPVIAEIRGIPSLKKEIFGPFLHIVTFNSNKKDELINEINDLGYGLTFGAHSRIDSNLQHLSNTINCGNIYLNRSMTGAIVESQPFGGRSMSGTGPKAGGPNYLKAFAHEKVISNNTAVSGGDYKLLNIRE